MSPAMSASLIGDRLALADQAAQLLHQARARASWRGSGSWRLAQGDGGSDRVGQRGGRASASSAWRDEQSHRASSSARQDRRHVGRRDRADNAGGGSCRGRRRRSFPARRTSRARAARGCRGRRRCASNGSPWRARKAATSSGRSRIAMPSIGTPAPLQLHQLRRLGDARHAPAGEDVDQARLPGREVGRGKPGLAGNAGGKREGRHGLPTSCDGSPCRAGATGATPPPRRTPARTISGMKRAAAHAHSSASRWRRRTPRWRHAGRSARAGRPSAISTPPSQIRVTNGFHHRRSCQRPSRPGWPITV